MQKNHLGLFSVFAFMEKGMKPLAMCFSMLPFMQNFSFSMSLYYTPRYHDSDKQF